MPHPWEPEQTLTPALALALVAEQFPDLSPTTIDLLGAGWDNTAYLINNEYVFRFPRRKIAVPLMLMERCLLPKIAKLLPLPIPVPQWMGTPSKTYPWPFAGYRQLGGTTACRNNLTDVERLSMAPMLANFLKALHALPLSVGRECHLHGDDIKRLKVSRLVPILQNNLDELNSIAPLQERERLLAIASTADRLRTPVETTIVHGDFYIRHLLLDEGRQLAGIIDWGDVHLGDPAIDIAIAHSFLPKAAHELFRTEYGGVTEETWLLARLRALYQSSFLALYGHHNDDAAIAAEGYRALKRIAADA